MRTLLQQIAERARPFVRSRLWLAAAGLGAAAVAGGCGSESAVTTVPTPVKCQVALAGAASSIAPEGGTGTLSITTAPECPWDVSTAANWLSGLSPSSGQGTSTVEFRIAPNPLPSTRAGDIVVNDSRLQVSQQAAPCRFELRPGSLAVAAGGDIREVAVSTLTGCSWSLTTDVNWISSTTRTGSGPETVRVSIAPNQADAPRTGAIMLGDQKSTVTQAGAALTPGTPGTPGQPGACTYSISPTNAAMGAAGGTGTVTVTSGSGCAWTASSGAGWVTVSSGASGSGNGAVTFSVAANTGAARSGTLAIAGRTFTVTQSAAAAVPCTYSISPTSASTAAAGGTGTVTVSAGSGCAWTASSSAGWVTVTSGASGSGNGSVAFIVAPNTGGARSGTLIIASQTFTVSQAALPVPCAYSISPTNVEMDEKGGSGSVAVSTASGCAWTASSNADWITVTSGASGTGSGTVGYRVADLDKKEKDRTGTVTIAGRTFTVKQKE